MIVSTARPSATAACTAWRGLNSKSERIFRIFDLTGRGRSDEFYAEVAAVYASLVSQTHQPVAVMAEKNTVARVTAHRWVKQARDRGLLPPGRPGKAG